ncbi:MAG: non-homologous end-joining DNA ligase, partial [Bryobacteraceae bacterium]
PHHCEAAEAILDGEIAVLDEKGRPNFGLIQPRIHQTDPNSISHLLRTTPVTFFAFDLLYWDGYDLRNSPLSERRKALSLILKPSARIQLSTHMEGRGEDILEAARAAGLEGIIAKRSDSKYEGRRSDCWRKIKVTGEQEFVICGYTHGERETFSSLVLGLYQGSELTWCGNVGTGFNEQSLAQLHKRLATLETDRSPFKTKPAMLRKATWVKPELVCQCRYSEWTKDGRLRAPVYIGLRSDKSPKECAREVAVAEANAVSQDAPRQAGPLLPARAKEVTLRIDNRPIRFSNLDKVYFPKDGCKKRDLLSITMKSQTFSFPILRSIPSL